MKQRLTYPRMEQFVLVAIKGPANSNEHWNIGWKTAEGLENVKSEELKKFSNRDKDDERWFQPLLDRDS